MVQRAAINARENRGGGNLESLPFAFAPLLYPHSGASCAPGIRTGVLPRPGAAGGVSLADGYLLLQCLPALPHFCPQSQGLEDFQEDCSYPNKCLEKSPEELPWGLRSRWGHPRRDGRGVKPGHCFHSTRAGRVHRLFSADASGKFILLKLSSVA